VCWRPTPCWRPPARSRRKSSLKNRGLRLILPAGARRLGRSAGHVIARMLANVALDGIVGAVPDCRRRLRRDVAFEPPQHAAAARVTGARASEGRAGSASSCFDLRHTVPRRFECRSLLPHRVATTKASKYARALRKLRRVRHPMVRTVRRAFGGGWQHTLGNNPVEPVRRQFDCRHVAWGAP
jgi:hypothetical protein